MAERKVHLTVQHTQQDGRVMTFDRLCSLFERTPSTTDDLARVTCQRCLRQAQAKGKAPDAPGAG